MKHDLLAWAKGGIRRFFIATHDGGFTQTVRVLTKQGCEVIGIGNSHASARLKAACSRFVLLQSRCLDTQIQLERISMPTEWTVESDFASEQRLEEARKMLYGSYNGGGKLDRSMR